MRDFDQRNCVGVADSPRGLNPTRPMTTFAVAIRVGLDPSEPCDAKMASDEVFDDHIAMVAVHAENAQVACAKALRVFTHSRPPMLVIATATRLMAILLALVASLPLVACASRTETAPLVRVQAQPAAQAGCAPAARAVAPAYALAVAEPTGVVSEVGPAERTRAALAIPGGVVECTGVAVGEAIGVGGRWLKCLGESLVPKPTPSVRYVYGSLQSVETPCCGDRCAPPSPRPIPLPPPPPQGPGGGLEPNIPDPGVRR